MTALALLEQVAAAGVQIRVVGTDLAIRPKGVLPADLRSKLAASKTLSVLATGGGFAVRQLYTNREEEIFQAQRPIILNGISQVATRGDLLDRAIGDHPTADS